MEDYAYVLDVLPEGRPDSKRRFRREPVIYGLGIMGASMITVSGIFIAVSYITKTYEQGFQEALGATNKRVENESINFLSGLI